MTPEDFDVPVVKLIERQLIEHYGPMIGNDNLCRVLGYPSKVAFRQATLRNKVPVPIFDVENRRGKFALVIDVARWLADQREQAINIVAAANRLAEGDQMS